jgi:hypothetical protein
MSRSAIIPAFILCVGAAGSVVSAETRIMATTLHGQTRTSSTHIYERVGTGGLEIVIEDEDGRTRSILDAEGRVTCELVESPHGSLVIASDGATLRVSGSWKGKRIDFSRDLKGIGFYGCRFEFAIRAMISQGIDSMKFVMIHREDPSDAAVMELRREGAEIFNGCEAIRLRISLTGLLSHFWAARFLVDSEGRILRFSGSRGPGTSTMVIELVNILP